MVNPKLVARLEAKYPDLHYSISRQSTLELGTQVIFREKFKYKDNFLVWEHNTKTWQMIVNGSTVYVYSTLNRALSKLLWPLGYKHFTSLPNLVGNLVIRPALEGRWCKNVVHIKYEYYSIFIDVLYGLKENDTLYSLGMAAYNDGVIHPLLDELEDRHWGELFHKARSFANGK
jgi:hypothetical protein